MWHPRMCSTRVSHNQPPKRLQEQRQNEVGNASTVASRLGSVRGHHHCLYHFHQRQRGWNVGIVDETPPGLPLRLPCGLYDVGLLLDCGRPGVPLGPGLRGLDSGEPVAVDQNCLDEHSPKESILGLTGEAQMRQRLGRCRGETPRLSLVDEWAYVPSVKSTSPVSSPCSASASGLSPLRWPPCGGSALPCMVTVPCQSQRSLQRFTAEPAWRISGDIPPLVVTCDQGLGMAPDEGQFKPPLATPAATIRWATNRVGEVE